MRSGSQRTLIAGAVVLFTLSGLSLIHLTGGPSRLLHLVLEMDSSVVVAMLFLFLAELVKAVRLTLFARSYGLRVPLHWALTARLVGRFFGVLTPAYSGATPARAAVIAAASNMEPGSAFGITTIESLFDTFLPIAVTLILTIPLLPATWLAFLTSLFLASLWLGGIGWVRTDRFVKFVNRRVKTDYACYLLRQRDKFLKSMSSILRNRLVFTIGLTLTLAAHIVETYSILVLSHSATIEPGWSMLESVWKSFLALEISNVMVMSPTPGGALFFEYGLTGVLDPALLVWWRITYVVFSLIPGLLILLLLGRVREYARSLLETEVKTCEASQVL
ncbi:MAG: flippase-like domain-containing protein [Desulfurococcales archaeon]|nr:flippase-like domain-containing protein [Desulfurococcales archaeon]